MAGVEQVIGGLDSWGSGGALQGGVMTGCICNLKAYVRPGLNPFTCRMDGIKPVPSANHRQLFITKGRVAPIHFHRTILRNEQPHLSCQFRSAMATAPPIFKRR